MAIITNSYFSSKGLSVWIRLFLSISNNWKILTMKQNWTVVEIKNKNKNKIFTNIPIYIYTLAKVNKIFPPLENSGTYTEAKTLFWKICIKFHFFPKRFWKMYWYGCFPSNFVKYFKTRVVLKNLYHLITSI